MEAMRKARAALRDLLKPNPGFALVRNANGADERRGRGFALLEYLPLAFRLQPGDPALLRHQNLRRCRLMAAGLGELGYVVDVGHRRDLRPRRRNYDLILSDRQDWRGLDRAFRPEARRVFLAQSLHHAQHNANLGRRHTRLAERRGCTVAARRVYGEQLPALARCGALAGPGNETTMGSWRQSFAGAIHPFNNFSFSETTPPRLEAKDFDQARRNFLFFASRTQLMKGLDLLLEVFPALPDLHLYVCSNFRDEPDFCACYHRELFETPNIHPIGWAAVNGPEYADVAARCAWVLGPTCSEGQSGAVVQCLASGLAPLVTREAGLDVEGFGLTFADDSLETIGRTVAELAQRPAEWHRRQAEAALQAAQAHYTEAAFVNRWRAILAEVTG